MWQPFNYNYIVAYKQTQEAITSSILGGELNENTVWKDAVERGHKENEQDPKNVYTMFNLSVGYYHLGDFEKSVSYFELVEERLPKRMLWYQIEPIKAYQQTGDYKRALELIQDIFDNGNRAFSELYYLRGQIYLNQQKAEDAKAEFEKALQYNANYQQAKDALAKL